MCRVSPRAMEFVPTSAEPPSADAATPAVGGATQDQLSGAVSSSAALRPGKQGLETAGGAARLVLTSVAGGGILADGDGAVLELGVGAVGEHLSQALETLGDVGVGGLAGDAVERVCLRSAAMAATGWAGRPAAEVWVQAFCYPVAR